MKFFIKIILRKTLGATMTINANSYYKAEDG